MRLCEITQLIISEGGGYVPINQAEANDPRWCRALSVDVRPGEVQKQAAKMGFVTDRAGVPPTLKTNGEIDK